MKKETQKEQIRLEFIEIRDVLDERSRRRWCGAKARTYNRQYGRGGVTIVHEATGISRSCIYTAIKEIEELQEVNERMRKEGGGRKKN